jgi:hypothetical protein
VVDGFADDGRWDGSSPEMLDEIQDIVVSVNDFVPSGAGSVVVCFLRAGAINRFPVQGSYHLLPGTVIFSTYLYRGAHMAAVFNSEWMDTRPLWMGQPNRMLSHAIAMARNNDERRQRT